MLHFANLYNPENLKSASECIGIPLSHVKYQEMRELSIQNLPWMGTTQSISDIEEQEGLKFGWGKDLPLEEVIGRLKEKYRANFISTRTNIDPIIVINGGLYDGWKRCILAHALGQSEVLCALFETLSMTKPHLYVTEEERIKEVRHFIEKQKLTLEEESHDGGVFFYFQVPEDLVAVKLFYESL